MNKTDAAEILQKYVFDDEECIAQDMKDYNEALKMAIEALQTEAEKKKAELKENGYWDCPDAGCDECDHHRSVEWCSLAIPNHEKEIDETYKMVNEAFFEGFDTAEKRYRFLIEYVEELDKKLAEAEWIPVKTRPMDEEERREWSEKFGYDIEYDEAVIYTSQLPDDGQAVLTCNRYGNITIDTFENDPENGCGFEENGDMDGIVAWMPLPEPYREDGE